MIGVRSKCLLSLVCLLGASLFAMGLKTINSSGFPSSVGTSALAINGFNDQPPMRIPLMVATIASWFTLASLFLSSMQVHDQLEWVRPLHFLVRRHLIAVRLGTHETRSHVSC